ncbi:hypothetical protein LINPERPRIM_LOCUS39785, partial [Linum perenne]
MNPNSNRMVFPSILLNQGSNYQIKRGKTFVRLGRVEWYQPLGPIQPRTSRHSSRRSFVGEIVFLSS